MPLTVSNTCIKCIYVDEYSIIDRFYGSRLLVWGDNNVGQLGIDSTVAVSSASPVETVARGSNWKDVIVGSNPFGNTLMNAIKNDGTIWAWGANPHGSIGDNTTINRSSPVQTIAGGSNWKCIGGHGTTRFAITNSGQLWAWGQTYNGSIGDGQNISRSSPVQIGTNTNWRTVTGNARTSAAIKMDGTLWTWGGGNIGALGGGSLTSRSSPVQVGSSTDWKQVAAGYTSFYALKNDGTLWAWGDNNQGRLGVGDAISRCSPTQVLGGATWKCIKAPMGERAPFALKNDRTIWSWGRNQSPEWHLGHNDTISKSSPVQIFAGGTDWKFVVNGYRNPRAVKLDGSFWEINCNSVANITPGNFVTTNHALTSNRTNPSSAGITIE